MITEQTIQTVAKTAAQWFETAKRDDGSEYVTLPQDAPEWIRDMVYAAHAGMLPDDWKYACIAAACEWIAENDPDDVSGFADSQVDIYNGERLAWLASHGDRAGYCDEAAAEFGLDRGSDGEYGRGGGDTTVSIIDRIGWGQYMEASEVYSYVLAALV